MECTALFTCAFVIPSYVLCLVFKIEKQKGLKLKHILNTVMNITSKTYIKGEESKFDKKPTF